MKKTIPVLLLMLPGLIYADPITSTPDGPYTLTEVCPQTNPTVGVEGACITKEGGATTTNTVNATVGTGQFSGTATGNSHNGAIGAATSVTLTNYQATNNIFTNAGYAPNMAYAQGTWNDTISVNGLPSTYNLTYTFNLDGSFSSNNAYFDSSLEMITTILFSDTSGLSQSNDFEQNFFENDPIPASFTQTFTGLTQSAFQENFTLIATTGTPVFTADQVPTYQGVFLTGTGSANFASTLHVGTLLFTDVNGKPITGLSISSDDGFAYTLDPANLAVPEPSTAALSVGALMALWALRKRFQTQA